jgi:ribonuclease D
MPPPRVWADKNPVADRRLKLARAAVTEVSELLSIPVENVLTPDLLRRIAWLPPEELTPAAIGEALEALGAREWQIGATSQAIADAFVEANQTPEEAPESVS